MRIQSHLSALQFVNSVPPDAAVLGEREHAAPYLGCSYSKLQRLRKSGKGPVFVKIGRNILYRKRDLDAFLDGHSSNAA